MFTFRRTDALPVFIHVPKTAGSTVNAHLAAWARGQDHLEHFTQRPATLQRKLARAAWVSGHLALNKMQALSAQTHRPLMFYGVMREPVSQIASHYNWFMEIAHRGGRFFRGHPEGVQDFSRQLQASDNTNPAVVVANIKSRQGQFLNLQSRYLLGDDLKFSADTGAHRLPLYACLSVDPAQVITQITGAPPTEVKRENASPYHFDPAVFQSDEVQDYLHRAHAFDLKLYARLATGAT